MFSYTHGLIQQIVLRRLLLQLDSTAVNNHFSSFFFIQLQFSVRAEGTCLWVCKAQEEQCYQACL